MRRQFRRGFKVARSRPSPFVNIKSVANIAAITATNTAATSNPKTPVARRLFYDDADDTMDDTDDDSIGAALESLRKAVLAARAEAFKKRWAFDIINDKPVVDNDSKWSYSRIV